MDIRKFGIQLNPIFHQLQSHMYMYHFIAGAREGRSGQGQGGIPPAISDQRRRRGQQRQRRGSRRARGCWGRGVDGGRSHVDEAAALPRKLRGYLSCVVAKSLGTLYVEVDRMACERHPGEGAQGDNSLGFWYWSNLAGRGDEPRMPGQILKA